MKTKLSRQNLSIFEITTIVLASTTILIACQKKPEWVEIDSTDSDYINYIDLSSRERTGTGYKIWNLISYKKPKTIDGKYTQSTKQQLEFNCSEEMVRTLQTTWTSRSEGRGKIVKTAVNKHPRWIDVPPTSTVSVFLEYACGERQ